MSDRHAEGSEESHTIDAWFDILGDPRRRFLCRYLLHAEAEIVTQEELVESVCERDAAAGDTDFDQEHAAMELRHVHLPKLDSLDAVEYNPRSAAVHVDSETLSASLEDLQSTIEAIRNEGVDD